ncbi:hypothetical protein Taro_008656 [Colocasia esculenta]|uniref:Uncharacterized protein n=1 Tax=Colocasia esculenta TaxID=4460 RepID=A0A843U2W6_COLES|nr:hypothetical protein [Colocasia esculenta]
MGLPIGSTNRGWVPPRDGSPMGLPHWNPQPDGKYTCIILFFSVISDIQVACFPFDDHNCPPLQLVISFCQSAYSWLKEDIENVVVVHCKAGMARTGLMISSLLLYLKFFPTAEESMDYYNQKRCLDGKGLVLPICLLPYTFFKMEHVFTYLIRVKKCLQRYVKYFERILTYFNGENPPGRRCMLRGFRLHRCPYWVRPSITVSNHNGVLFSTKKHPRTKDLMPEDFWFSAPKKGIMVFALPGEPGLTELAGDFKIHFHDRQGDFYCWLNTTMTENRKILNTSDLDGFDKRKLPSPGFQLEVVLVDFDDSNPTRPTNVGTKESDGGSASVSVSRDQKSASSKPGKDSGGNDKDDVFSDSETEDSGSSRGRQRHVQAASGSGAPDTMMKGSEAKALHPENESMPHRSAEVPAKIEGPKPSPTTGEMRNDGKIGAALNFEAPKLDSTGMSEFKAIAADASVFSFGDEEDYESE